MKGLKGLILKLMRVGLLPIFLITAFTGALYANPADGQKITDKKITLSVDHAELKSVLGQISRQVDVKFVYSAQKIPCRQRVSVFVENEKLGDVLTRMLQPHAITYEVAGSKIVLRKLMSMENEETGTANASQAVNQNEVFREIKGKVTDEGGKPLAAVSVTVKGTNKGTSSDANGNFTIDANTGDVLEFSIVGYKAITFTIADNSPVTIALQQDVAGLSDVVVVGYGTQKKLNSVGAQASVKPVELKLPVGDISTSLSGRISGLIAINRTGAPGADPAALYIRGISSYGSNGPLLVVDGVPDRNIQFLDPEDVESITILKDATTTAVYGTRGANGVILIETKKGKAGKPSINVEFNRAVTQYTELPEFVDGPTFMKLYNTGLEQRGLPKRYSEDQIALHASGIDPELYPNTNWFKTVFNDYGSNMRFNLNANGGSENANYYISVGYFNEVGLYKRDKSQSYNSTLKYERFNFTNNSRVNLTKTTKLELGLAGYISLYNQPGGGVDGIFDAAVFSPPHILPPRYSNGQWPQNPGTPRNPYMQLVGTGYSNSTRLNITSNIRGTQELDMLVKGLSFTTLFSFDVNTTGSVNRFRNMQTHYATSRDRDGNLITSQTEAGSDILDFYNSKFMDRKIYMESALNYKRTFGVHDVTAMGLFQQQEFVNFNIANGAANYIYAIPFRKRGFVGRATYGFDRRYFAEYNFGYTGSENFAPANRFGFTPSYGVAWVPSNEKWFEPLADIVSLLKFRYSFGFSGGESGTSGGRFLYQSVYNTGGGYTFGVPGNSRSLGAYYEGLIGNDRLGWETSRRHNLGIELNLFNSDLKFIVELFKEDRYGILIKDYTIPYNSGFTSSNIPYSNVGKTKNKGIDITASYDKKINKDAFVTTRITFNTNRNLAVYDGLPPWRYPWLNRIGLPISQRFGYIAEGLFESEEEIASRATQSGDVRVGDIKYKDINGDGVITTNDQMPIGYGNVPRMQFGFNVGGGYKGFDVILFFQGAAKVDFNYISGGLGTVPFMNGASYGNVYSTMQDHWTPDTKANGKTPFYPRMSTSDVVTTNYYTSTWWIKRADYLRLKSAELGYSFNNQALKKFAIRSLRVYVNGTNLFTWSKWKFWDPELGDGNGTSYPNTTAYNAGVRINFN